MSLYQLTLLAEDPPAPVIRETELKTITFCPVCKRPDRPAYRSETVCVECKGGKYRLLEDWYPELIRYRILPQPDKAHLKPWDIRVIWLAGQYKCLRCKKDFEKDLSNLHLDHVVPQSAGGPTSILNTQPLCYKCNSRKQASKNWRSWDCRPPDWLERLNVARNQLRGWTVGGRSFEALLRELVRE